MTNIKVSVLTPIYNHKIEYVEQCLESLRNQTMQEIEFILIDNGATQESKDLIEKYVNLDSRFRVIHLEENQGYSGAMNTGFNSANGEYIGIVESDDWVEEVMFERLYTLAKENSVSFVKSCYYEQNLEDVKLKNVFDSLELNKKLSTQDLPNFLLHHASPWSILYKKELLDNAKIRISEGKGAVGKDIGLVIKAFLAAKEIYITSEAFYHYNVYNPNASMKIQDTNHILKMLFNEYNNIYIWAKDMIEQKFLCDKCLAFIDKRLFFNMQCNMKFNKISCKNMKNIASFLKNNITNFALFSKKDLLMYNELIKNPKRYYYEYYKNKKYLSIFEKIFSVKNSQNKKHKIITILGIKIKFAQNQKTPIQPCNPYSTLTNKLLMAWNKYHTQAVINEFELLYDNKLYWQKLPNYIWLVYISSLIEFQQINLAKRILKRYIMNYGYKDMERYLPVANFAFENGYQSEMLEKASFIFKTLEANVHNNILEKYIQNKSIAIVGNAGTELGLNKKLEIDNHDIIIRFNNFPKNYENDYGEKTNIWIHGIGAWQGDIRDDRDLSKLDLVVWYQDIWHEPLHFNHFDVLYKNLTEYPNKITYFNNQYHKYVINEHDLIFASSGALTLISILKMSNCPEKIEAYGFAFLDELNKHNTHYYDNACRIGQDHNFDYEKEIIKNIYSKKDFKLTNTNEKVEV